MTAAPTIVFDLDGTLIDSRDAMVAAFAAAFRRTVGAGPAPVGEFLALQGKRFDEILAALGLPVAMWEPFIEESRLRVDSVPVIPGVQALLERLVAGGYQLALLTGKDRGRTDELLAALGLSAFFSAVVTSTDGLPTKPAPDAVWAILELLECDPRRACLVGDAPDQGERFAERALSAATTCRQQDRSLFEYLAQLLAAHTRGDPLPALT